MAMFRASGKVESRPPNAKENKECDNEQDSDAAFCNICLEGWDSETEVAIHRKTAHKTQLLRLLNDPKKNVCNICITPHKDRMELINHIKTVHLLSSKDAPRIEREIFICDCCCALFFNKHLLQVHILIFHTNLDRVSTRTECPKCLKMYRLKTIWYHFQGHSIQSVSCCKICMTKCKNRKDLQKHVDEHTKHLFCDICQYQSKSEKYYKEHMATRHKRVSKEKLGIRWEPYFMPRVNFYKQKLQCDTAAKGLQLEIFSDLQIKVCVLCREICMGQDHAIDHLENDHKERVTPKAEYKCNCGSTFNNKVLLKHHIFKEKGDHAEVDPKQEVVYTIVVLTQGDEEEPMTT